MVKEAKIDLLKTSGEEGDIELGGVGADAGTAGAGASHDFDEHAVRPDRSMSAVSRDGRGRGFTSVTTGNRRISFAAIREEQASGNLSMANPRLKVRASVAGTYTLELPEGVRPQNTQSKILHAVGVTSAEEEEFVALELEAPRIAQELRQRASVDIVRRPTRAATEVKKDGKQWDAAADEDEHAITWEELSMRLQITSDLNPDNVDAMQGLPEAEAATRLARDGPNVMSPPKQKPEWLKFALQFTNMFMVLLMAAAILEFIAYITTPTVKISLWVGIILILIVILTCTVTYFQEGKNSSVMATFANMLPQQARVKRGGVWTNINAADLVVGDLVKFGIGEKVPADIRVLKAAGIKVDNASLTGESEPVGLGIHCTNSLMMESKNIGFFGSLIVDGEAEGIVVRIGDNTLIGRIAKLASSGVEQMTTLQREVNHFVHFITVLAVTMGVSFFALGFIRKYKALSGMVNAIGIIVANVPEGLPMCVTGCLTISARKLAERNVFVKKLESVETLGSVTCIASDKTGTLTQNRMTVSHLWYDLSIKTADQSVKDGTFSLAHPSFVDLFRIQTCCCRAEFQDNGTDPKTGQVIPLGQRLINGDASESALVRFAHPIRDIEQCRATNKKLAEIRFNSTNKYQLSIHQAADDDEDKSPWILMKGAPEVVLRFCSDYVHEGKAMPRDDRFADAFDEAYTEIGGLGERVLGFACRRISATEFPPDYVYNIEEKNFPMEGLAFVGFTSLVDPPRETVPGAIRDCQSAGVQVIMVTGDHALTAQAIARNIGILKGDTVETLAKKECVPVADIDPRRAVARVITGPDVTNLTEPEWDTLLELKEIVVARASPENKLQLVHNLQRRGHIVAVTGDGVNDSPALKAADIGVAMGIVGSDVAKEAARLILMDDNFASIVNGIEEGRRIFDNLRKSICYTLAHLVPEIMPFILNIALGWPLGLSAELVLSIDLITEAAPSLSCAYETAESDIMSRPPRNSAVERLVTKPVLAYSYIEAGLIISAACIYNFYFVMTDQGFPISSLANSATHHFTVDTKLCVTMNIGNRTVSCDTQNKALEIAQSSWFLTIVIMQMVNIICCKTRTLSVFQHGMWNMHMNAGLLISPMIAVVIVYVPFMHDAFATAAVDFKYIVPILPFGLFLFLFCEIRKLCKRRGYHSWLDW